MHESGPRLLAPSVELDIPLLSALDKRRLGRVGGGLGSRFFESVKRFVRIVKIVQQQNFECKEIEPREKEAV